MNIVSAMVGLSIIGAAAPSMLQMSLAPFEAQKRAQNLGTAESAAVTYAAANEGAMRPSEAPNDCTLNSLSNLAYQIECTEGDGKYIQTVARSFRLNPNSNIGSPRTFPYDIQGPYVHQCNAPDEWGIGWSEQWPTLSPCIPQAAWDRDTYLASNPDDWLYDINNIRGFGNHPDY